MQGFLSGHVKAAPSTLLRHSWSGQYPLSLLSSIGRHRRCQHGATAAMSSDAEQTQISAAFKSADDQAAFTGSFKLAEGAGATLQIQGVPDASSTAAAANTVHSWLNTSAVFQHLKTQRMGRSLLSTPSIPSTQEFMRLHSSVLPDGTVLVADQQTKGKGRGGNVWTSPAGCLMFTALRHLQVQGTQAAFINYVVCLAVVQGIKEATKDLLPGGLDVQIKWPNDIYHQGVKIGGALIHTTWAASTQQFCVLTGIGLNVSNNQPTTCLDDIIRSRLQQQQQQQVAQDDLQSMRVCKEQLLASVLTHLESCFDVFQAQGFEPLRLRYLASWMHSNQVVELEDSTDQGSAGAGGLYPAKRVPLTIVGLSPHGFLLAEDPLGQQYELTPDGNSLDMMQGLIKKKLH